MNRKILEITFLLIFLIFVYSAKAAVVLNASDYIGFNVSGIERARITDLGYLGIGTLNPSYPLHVVGNGYFSGDLYIMGKVGIVVFDLTNFAKASQDLIFFISQSVIKN